MMVPACICVGYMLLCPISNEKEYLRQWQQRHDDEEDLYYEGVMYQEPSTNKELGEQLWSEHQSMCPICHGKTWRLWYRTKDLITVD